MNKIDFIIAFGKKAKKNGLTVRDAVGLCALAKITGTQKECMAIDVYHMTGDKGMGQTLSSLKNLVEVSPTMNDHGTMVNLYRLTDQGISTIQRLLNPEATS
jgi:hypothetical protein